MMGTSALCRLRPLAAMSCLLLAAAAVRGQDGSDQDKMVAAYRQAQALRKEGKLPQAIAQYEKALALAPEVLERDDPNLATLLFNVGGLYRETGQNVRAEASLRRALDIYEAQFGKDDSRVAATVQLLASLYRDMQQYAKAEPLFRRAVANLERQPGEEYPELAYTLSNFGKMYIDMGRPEKGEPLLRRALAIAEDQRGKDHPDVATMLDTLAGAYMAQGQYDQAEPLLRRGLDIRERKLGKDDQQVAESLYHLAVLNVQTVQYGEADRLLRRALGILEETRGPDHLEVATCLQVQGTLYLHMGRYARAEDFFRRSARIREERLGKDDPEVAAALRPLGAMYWHLGQYTRAEPLYRRCLEIQEAKLGPDHPQVAITLGLLAEIYKGLGQYDRAEPLYRRCARIQEKKLGEDHPDLAVTLSNLASLLERTGRGDKKVELLYQRAVQIQETARGEDDPAVASALDGLAGFYMHTGQEDEAEPLYRRTLRIEERRLGPNHPNVASTLNDLAVLAERRGQDAEALRLYRRSLQIREEQLGKEHPRSASGLENLAALHARRQEWAAAADAVDRARRIDRKYVADILPGLSEADQLTFLTRTGRAAWYWSLSLGCQRRDDESLAERSAAWLLNGKAVAQQALAERTLLARDGSDPRCAELARQLGGVRQRLAGLAFAPYRPGQAEGRLQQLARLTEQEQDLSRQLGQAGGRPARAVPWVGLAEVREALPPDAVLIEIGRFDRANFQARRGVKPFLGPRYAAWLVPPAGQGRVQVIDLGEAAAIERNVAAVRKALADSATAIAADGEPEAEKTLRRHLGALAGQLLRPLAPHVGARRQWFVSPDGPLWLVPWAALPVDEEHYAVEGHTIRYLVSGRDLVTPPQTAPRGADPPAIVADPDFDLSAEVARSPAGELPRPTQAEDETRGTKPSTALPRVRRLPFTAAEAEAIRPLLARFSTREPRLYLGADARESIVKSFKGPRVAVLATHGFFLADQEPPAQGPERADLSGVRGGPALTRDGRPLENPLLRCGLLLAGCNRDDERRPGDEDGILTGLEIVGCDLRGTELVVLSACETGLGAVNTGEGVAGLRQAFQLAGARAVLATLWQVQDRETMLLMTKFFAELARGRDRAEALRAAQLDRIQKRRDRFGAAHPLYWAAFTLTGR